jgi:hypothetical protein
VDSALGAADDFLSLPFLAERAGSELEQVRMWAAYHLLDRWPEQCREYIDRLWSSPTAEIRDSAAALIGRYGLQEYAFPLLRVFQSNEAGLTTAAGLALGRLRYAPAAKLLHQRFEALLARQDAATLDLEGAAESLLFHDNLAYWPLVHGRLAACQQNHAQFSALFRVLCRHAATPDQARALAQAYREPRETFHDPQLTQHLLGRVGRPSLSRYFQWRLNGGYPLNSIYHESLRVLGFDVSQPELARWIAGLADCGNSSQGVERFLSHTAGLAEVLPSHAGSDAFQAAFLEGCRDWAPRWDEAILKVRETEFHLLVSLPLAAVLPGAEQACLADPEGEALRIMHIYQSPLLGPEFMAAVLRLVAGRTEHADGAAPAAVSWRHAVVGRMGDEEKDALWKLFTRQLEGMDYPFDQVLPQPWSLGVPSVMERLTTVLETRFARDLAIGRDQAVDYALEVFRRARGTAPVELLLQHFDALINRHYQAFLDLMTHLPDRRFLPRLTHHFREGEDDLLRLIRFICDVHGAPYPETATMQPEDVAAGGLATARLGCPRCGAAYHYDLDSLFVDEERVEQRQIPQARDLWTPQTFRCKKCEAPVPFDPDTRFLGDLFGEIVTARLAGKAATGRITLGRIVLIPFPLLDGKALNPAEFLLRVQARLAQHPEPAQEVALLIELGKFNLDIGRLDAAKEAFERILSGPVRHALALYYLGVIAFQEKNLFAARVYFSRLTQGHTREEFDGALDNPVDMAHHYLKLLEKRDFKRSHFRLVST